MGALLLGLIALATAGWSLAAAVPAEAAIPEYQVFAIESPEPQSQPGTASASAFGERVRSLGDVDRDGARDVLVSNNNFDRNGLENVGRLWIFSGRTRAVLRTIEHPDPQAGAQFGFWSARLGDVDGDVVPDFVTSAPSQMVGGVVRQGQVYVVSGRTGTVLRTINHPDAPQTNGDFGGNVIAPGDLNGDGASDFVATASGTSSGSGAAYAFSGRTGALLYKVANPDAVQPSSFGFGASELGDVNGDRVGDYQIGSPRFDEGAVVDVGRSYTINGRTGDVIFTLRNPDVESMARFGQADADGIALGDITGDGRPDIFVDGFLSDDGAFLNAGAAYLFNGANGELIRALRDPNPVASGSFGASNASAGDIDRDGRPDQLVSSRGAIGRVTVFGGTGLRDVLTAFADPQAQTNALFGTGLAHPGDVNRDGLPDYFISARSADVDGAVNVGRLYAFISKAPPVYPLPPIPPSLSGAFAGCRVLTASVIRGTAASNVITGTTAADRIFAGTGDDRVDALPGDDCVDLGTGNDRGQGGLGADLVLSGTGNDRVSGSSGNDRLRGNPGNDRLDGGRGNDRVFGDAGNDTLLGSFGNDVLHGVSGRDRITGSRGRDRINGGSGADRISGGSSDDRISGDAGSDRINGNSGRDRVKGNSGNDRISARDRQRDRIDCGTGRDAVTADRIDIVSRSCERVSRR